MGRLASSVDGAFDSWSLDYLKIKKENLKKKV